VDNPEGRLARTLPTPTVTTEVTAYP